MAAFDKLPRSARQALANAAICWATQPFLSRHRRGAKGYRTGREIAERVAWADRNQHEKDAKRGEVPLVPRGAPFYLEPVAGQR